MAKKLFSCCAHDAPKDKDGKPDKGYDPRATAHKKLEECYAANPHCVSECRETVGDDGHTIEYSVWDGPEGSVREGQTPAQPVAQASPVQDEAFAELVAQKLAIILAKGK